MIHKDGYIHGFVEQDTQIDSISVALSKFINPIATDIIIFGII